MTAAVDRIASSAAPRPASVRAALVSLCLSMLLSSLGTSIANVALPTLAQAFEASFQQVQWVVLAYLLAITVLIVSVGRLGDLTGRRRLLVAGMALFILASVGCGLAPSLEWLVAARVAQGLGAAVMMALTLAFIGDTVPKEKTGSAMGLLGTLSAIGTALGPSLGGLLLAEYGWRAIFLINLPLGLLTLVLAYRYLPTDRPSSKGERGGFDPLGSLLLALTLGAYALAMTLGRGHFGALNLTLLLVAALGVGLFVWTEARVVSPLIRLALFRDPLLCAGLAGNLLVATVMMATLVVGPFYLAGALGLDALQLGLALSVGPLFAALTGIPAGRIVDRFGSQPTLLAGMLAVLGGALLVALLPGRFGLSAYLLPLVLMTSGFALFQAANNTAVMVDVRTEQRGLVSGLLNLSRNLGLVTGASLMGAVFAVASASQDLSRAAPEALAVGLRVTFAVAVGLILVGLVIVSIARRLAYRARLPATAVCGDCDHE